MKLKRGYYDVFVKTCAKYPSNIAMRYYEDGVYKKYTYSELYGVCEYITQNLQQMKCNKGVIGLVSDRNVIIPCMIAAAHKCCTTFMFVDPSQNIESIAKDVKFTVVIVIKNNSDYKSPEIFGKQPERTVSVFDVTINFFTLSPSREGNTKHYPIHSFIAMTSGSTGQPKHIQVPIKCIQPNIDDLTKMFNITSEDIIFFSTPLTFDPSMVEILLACMNGASLLIAPENANILFPDNTENSITFWQTTPSKFLQYSNADIQTKILSSNSTLKVLALGGEPLNGVKRLKELKDWDNKTKIFALYGVTEMSCWACVTEIDLNIVTDDKEIPLGNCLSETEVMVDSVKENRSNGKIILMSKTRKCIVLNKERGNYEENSLRFVDTGDIGEIRGGTIYYRGRRDDMIKRFGHKVNLLVIETVVMQCPRVKTCACVWLPKPMVLIVYFTSESISSKEISDYLKCKLDDKHWPDKVVRVDSLPTNSHGKISKFDLSRMYEKTTGIPQTLYTLKVVFLKELKEVLNKYYTYDQIKGKDFISIGGTSFLAVTMCNKLSLTYPQFGNILLPYLISQRYTINDAMQIAQKMILGEETKTKKRGKRCRSRSHSEHDTNATEMVPYPRKKVNIDTMEFMVMWIYDTGKCVDASPTLCVTGCHLYVTVGSHSGKVIVVDGLTGELQGVLELKSRIEAAVLCYQNSERGVCAVVGTYSGTIICFALDTVQEYWRIKIGAMIKSKAVCCNDEIYIASYDGKVRCIDLMTGAIVATIDICEHGISADLVLAKKKYIIVASLSGVCACIQAESKGVIWQCKLGSSIFASPVLFDGDKYVVFAEVNGDVYCKTVEKGIKIWKFHGVKGNVFSSFNIKNLDKNKWQIVFGCHDRHVYSILVKNHLPILQWKAEVSAPVYATPCSLDDRYILAATTEGQLFVIDKDNGLVYKDYRLPHETFSSPSTYNNYIFIGCRNDHLYAIKYV